MKTKFTWIVCLFFVSLASVPVQAQQNPSRAERLNAQRVAFITERLQLTPEEAQKFWPVYNEYRDKKMKLEKQKVKLVRDYSSRESTLTDKEAAKIAGEYVALEQKQADLLVAYNKKFLEVLPPQKVLRLYRAENQFTVFLLRQLRERQRRDNPPPRKF